LTTEADIEKARGVYDASFFKHDFARHTQFLDDCPQGFYKAQVEQFWYNIEGVDRCHFVDTRREVIS
jgi:hypothetical protein